MSPHTIQTLATERQQMFAAEVTAACRARQCPTASRTSMAATARLRLGAHLVALGAALQRRPAIDVTSEHAVAAAR